MRLAPDIVDPSWDDAKLREIYGADAAELIAFKRFLALPRTDAGQVMCPPDYLAYARGEISGAELLRRTDEA